jgi:hypothetical protein
MPDPITISATDASRVAMAAQKTYAKNRPKIGWNTHPLLALTEETKESQVVSGTDGEIIDGVTTQPSLTSQFWRGDDTINTPQDINGDLATAHQYFRMVTPIKLKHDEWLQKGYDIVPHLPGTVEERLKKLGKANVMKLHDDLVKHEMGKVNQVHDDNLENALWKQGASVKEPVGINAQNPILVKGPIYGQNRDLIPEMRSLVVGSTIGGSGTLIADLESSFRALQERSANCGMVGEWIPLAGGGWLSGYRSETKRQGLTFNTEASGVKKIDGLVLDSALSIGGLKPIYCSTLDRMDTIALSERGNLVSAAAAAFGGTGGTGAAGSVVVNGAGTVTNVVVTNFGSAYTDGGAITITGGGGTGATATFAVYSTSAGANRVQVAADDYRLGQVATVTITAPGSGFTVPTSPLFTNRCYFKFKPGLKYKVAQGGQGPIDRRITVPADPARNRYTEFQMETVAYFYSRTLALDLVSYF